MLWEEWEVSSNNKFHHLVQYHNKIIQINLGDSNLLLHNNNLEDSNLLPRNNNSVVSNLLHNRTNNLVDFNLELHNLKLQREVFSLVVL